MVLCDAAEPLPLRVAGARDLKWSRHQVQVHAQLVEPKAILVKAAAAQLRVVPTEPHAHPDMLCLYVEVLGALNVDQHQLAAVVEQYMVRPEFAVYERKDGARPADTSRRAAASNRTSREAWENGSAGSSAPPGSVPCQ